MPGCGRRRRWEQDEHQDGCFGVPLRCDWAQFDRGPDAVGDWIPTALLRMLPRLRISPSRLLPPPPPCWARGGVDHCRQLSWRATHGNHLIVRHRYARAPSTVHGLCHRPKSPGVHCRHRAASLFCLAQRGRAGGDTAAARGCGLTLTPAASGPGY
jgi:hypothetical protein